ncbi:hypothetical protein KBZ10_16500 [Streptomyces sp. F63]|uniref:hypothetical protein n=1 Tax=Streptomyces sp. F63 TaxID=2824887 RepID=UPI001B366772|nr:hypothetical protein [Streptomyces sp. F63]MBQ0986084.1 hypothetical protein [Streptomyces sp. F63]
MPDPDHFDRLLARHTPVRAVAGAAAPARVRPRLPGPFERVESLRAADPGPEEGGPLSAPAAPAARGPVEMVRREREVRTDRHTVVRSSEVPRGEPVPPVTARPAAPLLRPAAPVPPGPRPAGRETPRRERRGSAPAPAAGGPGPTVAAAAPHPPGVVAAPPAAVPPRPREADAAAAREAARSGAGRRRGRGAEQVVHVEIGRLEVSAAGAARPGERAGGGSGRTGRPAPALSLDDYLTRGGRRS